MDPAATRQFLTSMRYFIISGEPSGHVYAQQLMHALTLPDSEATFHYIGPDSEGAVMGVTNVLAGLGRHIKKWLHCQKELLAFAPDVLILIDYPSFNLRMARFAHRHGIKTFYYIAPKIWASREKRIKALRKYVDTLFVIFPFETAYFERHGMQVQYLGNPLLDVVHEAPYETNDVGQFRQVHGLNNKPILAILPGSRKQEISFVLPRVLKFWTENTPYEWVIAGVSSIPDSFYLPLMEGSEAYLLTGHTHELLKYATIAVVTSGTATLEAALMNCPQVVCYGGDPLFISLARRIIKVKYISLPNLILDREAITELIQNDCTPKQIQSELFALMPGHLHRDKVMSDYKALHDLLGGRGATQRIAMKMVELLTGQVPDLSPKIYTRYTRTPFGNFAISANQEGLLTAARFEDDDTLEGYYCNQQPTIKELAPDVLNQAVAQIKAYFEGTLRVFDLPLLMEGTDFQNSVWETLRTVPYGTTLSYTGLAKRLGNEKAARAVGQANNANPFAIIVPCHRIIGQRGSLVGYAGGLERKQKLLAMEKTFAPESSNSLF